MIFCRQKDKHCFVACCASFLGQDTFEAQESIVNKFPKELNKGTKDEGVVVATHDEICEIFKKLGIATTPQPILMDAGTLRENLKTNRDLAERFLIFTQKPTNHFVRIKEIHDDGLVVMNPSYADFHKESWLWFENSDPQLFYLI